MRQGVRVWALAAQLHVFFLCKIPRGNFEERQELFEDYYHGAQWSPATCASLGELEETGLHESFLFLNNLMAQVMLGAEKL